MALPEDEISAEDYEAVLNFLYDASKYIGLKTTEGHHYKRVVLQRTALEARGLPPEPYMRLNGTYQELKAGLAEVTRGTEPPAHPDRMRRSPMHVNSAEGFVFISLHGDVFPSGYLPLNAGNVRETPLGEIYRESPLFQALRDKSQLEGPLRPAANSARSAAARARGLTPSPATCWRKSRSAPTNPAALLLPMISRPC